MPIYGYARVSTDGQTLAAQEAALQEAGAAKVYAEKVPVMSCRYLHATRQRYVSPPEHSTSHWRRSSSASGHRMRLVTSPPSTRNDVAEKGHPTGWPRAAANPSCGSVSV
jgi:hypothetical protein